MKNIITLFFFCYIVGINAFDCPSSNGIYANPNDYQSYYVCNNNCPRLEYCQSQTPYFSNNIRGCSKEPDNWIPRYYLTGIERSSDRSGSVLYVRQDGYQLLWTFDERTTSTTFTGHCINEAEAKGVQLRRILATNCINVFDVLVTASADRTFCARYRLHPQSALCDLAYPHENTHCRTLSF